MFSLESHFLHSSGKTEFSQFSHTPLIASSWAARCNRYCHTKTPQWKLSATLKCVAHKHITHEMGQGLNNGSPLFASDHRVNLSAHPLLHRPTVHWFFIIADQSNQVLNLTDQSHQVLYLALSLTDLLIIAMHR